jgi:hypothetical protein
MMLGLKCILVVRYENTLNCIGETNCGGNCFIIGIFSHLFYFHLLKTEIKSETHFCKAVKFMHITPAFMVLKL